MSTESYTEMPNMDISKTCTNCSKIKVCKFYMQFAQFKEGYEEQAEGTVRIPLEADGIAMTCTEYDGQLEMPDELTNAKSIKDLI